MKLRLTMHNFKKIIVASGLILVLSLFHASSVYADTLSAPASLGETYFRAQVVAVATTTTVDVTATFRGAESGAAILELEILSGALKGQRVPAGYEENLVGKLAVGDKVVVARTADGGEANYYVVDPYRLNRLVLLGAVFFLVAIVFGRRRGLSAILGLAVSTFIIFAYLVPRLSAGGSPLGTGLTAALGVAVVSLFVAHGFNRRTAVAFVATIISLGLAVVVDVAFVFTARLTGASSEEAMYLQFGAVNFDLQGILLAGILIGVMGVLDDITTAQAAAVEEIHRANPVLSFGELYRRGLSVGREHIASLLNTLVLVYVGVSLPFILLFIQEQGAVLWVVLNSGYMAEEIVRTLVGSITLVLAVPITTLLAAYYYSHYDNSRPSKN